jgi:CO/xanthine dehydrogenase Mo-binding subunit
MTKPADIRPHVLSRRSVLAGGGALIVSFSLASTALAQAPQPSAQTAGKVPQPAPDLPGDLKKSPMLDSWIRIDADGKITVFTGKAELGQGIKTALIQLAAEELEVAPGAITLVTADTARTPNEGYTAGSHSMQDSGTAIMHAAAQVRALLLTAAAQKLQVSADQLKAQNGRLVGPDSKSLTYGQVVSGEMLHVRASPQSPLKPPNAHTVMGKSLRRVDIPAKVTGGEAYVQDLRLPNMVHARVVRPPSYGARLKELDASKIEHMPGVLKVIHDGSYLAVIAEKEFQAIQAMRALASVAQWQGHSELPDEQSIFGFLRALPSKDTDIFNKQPPADAAAGNTEPKPAKTLEATYLRPYQMHGSIGPSCAVGLFQDNKLTVWTHSQGVYPLRNALAELLHRPPEQVHCIHLEGSGCYGHNAADDAAADAALLATAVPGRPVRVQWMREDENRFEPFGPAMVAKVNAGLGADGKIVDWHYEVWSNTHSTRPAPAGNLLSALYVEHPFAAPPPKPLPMPEGGGDRNAVPLYKIPRGRVTYHFIPKMPLRVSAMRGLGAYLNVFTIESFMDELAKAAGKDPVQFRLQHLDDVRAHDVVKLAADKFGWAKQPARRGMRGRGFAFARYKNLAAYCAIAAEVEVRRDTGDVRLMRVVAAVDSGEAVNPDGIRNQIEGAILQSASWTLYEAVQFSRTMVTSRNWARYPIMRFSQVPDSVEVHIVNRPGQPFLGTGECGQGPAAAAIGNAIADAIGVRLRELPLTRKRVKAAIGV